jgi:hypothetical protein
MIILAPGPQIAQPYQALLASTLSSLCKLNPRIFPRHLQIPVQNIETELDKLLRVGLTSQQLFIYSSKILE